MIEFKPLSGELEPTWVIDPSTVRTVATEIKLIHVAFQTDTHFQSLKLTEFFSPIQSFDD